MATAKQRAAARRNIRKAQAALRRRARPSARKRKRKTVRSAAQRVVGAVKRAVTPKRRKGASMARRKRRPARTVSRRGVGAVSGPLMMTGLGAVGAIGGGVISNFVPVNKQIRPLLPLALGIGMVAFARRRPLRAVGTGLAIAAAIAAVKQYLPDVPILSGEELGVPVELADYSTMGVPVDLAGAQDPYRAWDGGVGPFGLQQDSPI